MLQIFTSSLFFIILRFILSLATFLLNTFCAFNLLELCRFIFFLSCSTLDIILTVFFATRFMCTLHASLYVEIICKGISYSSILFVLFFSVLTGFFFHPYSIANIRLLLLFFSHSLFSFVKLLRFHSQFIYMRIIYFFTPSLVRVRVFFFFFINFKLYSGWMYARDSVSLAFLFGIFFCICLYILLILSV